MKMLLKLNCVLLLLIFVCNVSISQNNSWKIVDDANGIFTLATTYMDCDCADSLNCIVIGNYNLRDPINRVTSDGGSTWVTTLFDTVAVKSEDGTETFWPSKVRKVAYPSKDLCIALIDSGRYWISRDGCLTWKKQKITDFKIGKSYKIFFLDAKFGIITRSHEIYLTQDSAYSFSTLTVDELFEEYESWNFDDVFVFDNKVIYLLVYVLDNRSSYLCKSSDLGENWDVQKISEKRLYKMFFLNEDKGWLVGWYNPIPDNYGYWNEYIIHTDDYFNTVEVQRDTFSMTGWGLRDVYFMNESDGYAIGNFFRLYKTTNGGKDWYRIMSYDGDYLYGCFQFLEFIKPYVLIGATYYNERIYIWDDRPTSVINDNYSYKKYNLHPNPATDQITITLADVYTSTPEIDIIDMLGFSIKAEHNISEREITINTSLLDPGVYFLRIRSGGEAETRKFVVVR